MIPDLSARLGSDHPADLMALAARMADVAGAEVLPLFRGKALGIANKDAGGYDPVTEADRAAERAIRTILERERPDDAILGEEYGDKAGSSGLTWVLDPIDGTRGFVVGAPTWGILIALRDAHGPLYGVIDQPYTGERWEGGLGRATLTGAHGSWPLGTRPTTDLAQARLCTTYPEIGTKAEQAAFRRVAAQVELTRYGLDCYAYGLLAAGHVDLVIEAGLNAYDIAAPIAVIEAAGGVVTDWEGGPAHDGGRALAAANATLHARALAALDEARI